MPKNLRTNLNVEIYAIIKAKKLLFGIIPTFHKIVLDVVTPTPNFGVL
jgi:hypothetical protein